jgi:hypothetical protein
MNAEKSECVQPLLAARLSTRVERKHDGRYDEIRQVTVDSDDRPIVETMCAGLQTITEADRDRADPIDPGRGLETTTKTSPDPADPVGAWLSPVDTISRTSSPDPADPAGAWLPPFSHVDTATRTAVDADRPPRGPRPSGSDDLSTGVVAF